MCAVRDTSLHLTTTTPTSCSDAFERRLLQGVVHRLRLHPRVQRMESSWITNDRAPVPPDRRPQSDSPPTADVRRALRRRGGTPVSSGGAAAGERSRRTNRWGVGRGGGLGGAVHRDERDRCLGGSAARPGGRVRETHGRTRRADRPPSRQPCREGEEVSARANAAVAQRATRNLRQRPGGTPARALVRNAAVPSGGAVGVGRAAAASGCTHTLARDAQCTRLVRATRAQRACRAPPARDSA
jgi:hypothetical protein